MWYPSLDALNSDNRVRVTNAPGLQVLTQRDQILPELYDLWTVGTAALECSWD